MKTAIWFLSVFLSKFYEMKIEKKQLDFGIIWLDVNTDFLIAKKCKNGNYLDDAIFFID